MTRSKSTRRRSRRLAFSISLVCMLCLVLLLVFPVAVAVKEDEARDVEAGRYGPVLGIDFCRTYPRVSVQRDGNVNIIPNVQGPHMSDRVSMLCGRVLPGEAAADPYSSVPTNTPFDANRVVCRKSDAPAAVRDLSPFRIVQQSGTERALLEGETRESISALIIESMKDTAEAYLGQSVSHAVVAVPAYFNDAQRQAVIGAVTTAGLHALRIVDEPIAAAIAYGLDRRAGEALIVVSGVRDGTLDVTVLASDDGVFEVLASAGDIGLHGKDFDDKIGSNVPAALNEETDAALLRKAIEHVERVLEDADVRKEDVDDILLVGDSPHFPHIQQGLTEHFRKTQLKSTNINPDEAVAYGAAVTGGILSGDLHPSLDGLHVCPGVSPITLGIETAGGLMAPIVPRNAVLPTRRSRMFTTTLNGQQPKSVVVRVYAGEKAFTKENRFLGAFELEVSPAPRGLAQIEVVFEVDEDGVLRVEATEKGTGKSASMTIIGMNEPRRPSDEEFERMVREAKEFDVEDQAERVHQRRDELHFE